MNPLLAAAIAPLLPHVAQGAKSLAEGVSETFSHIFNQVQGKSATQTTMADYLSGQGIHSHQQLQSHISDLAKSIMGEGSQPSALSRDANGQLWITDINAHTAALSADNPHGQLLEKLCAIRDHQIENPHLTLHQAAQQSIAPKNHFALQPYTL